MEAEPDPRRPDDSELTGLLRLLHLESDRFAERFGARHGLGRTDLNALALIIDAAGLGAPFSPGGLAARLGLSPSATTALIDRLEAGGHVERARTGGDRRRVTLAMPEAALEEGRRMFAPLGSTFAAAWEQFDDEQRRTVARFMRVSIEAMRAAGDTP